MPPAVSALASRFYGVDGFRRQSALRAVLIAASHLAALAIMLMTESGQSSRMAFILAWGILNTFFLVLVRRPAIAGVLSLVFVVLLVLLSQLKHSMLFMTVNFVDLMVVDQDTLGFLHSRFLALCAVMAWPNSLHCRGQKLQAELFRASASGRVGLERTRHCCPCFPSPLHSFRAAGFPRHGWKCSLIPAALRSENL